MRVTLTESDLVDFEAEVADAFARKEIPYPVHLSGGNERQLIEVFERHVGADDWLCCTWRSHYHCLLKGVSRAEVMEAVRAGHSIALCFPEQRVVSSAIVGGMAPVAVGLAMGIKRKREEKSRRVVCFLGDMAWESGGVQEAVKYAHNHGLPVTWVVEDNGLSCQTDTKRVWAYPTSSFPPYQRFWDDENAYANETGGLVRYQYENVYPHCGIGKHVQF